MADSSSAHRGIDETNRGFEEAFNAGDYARATQETYTEQARVLPPDMPTVEGRDNIAQFWQGAAQQMGIERVQLSTVELEVEGDHAHEIGRATLSLQGGQQVVAKYVVIWKQESGRWRWHIDIWNGAG